MPVSCSIFEMSSLDPGGQRIVSLFVSFEAFVVFLSAVCWQAARKQSAYRITHSRFMMFIFNQPINFLMSRPATAAPNMMAGS